MKIETFASGSTGNAYRVSDGRTALLLECGLPIRKLRKCSGYRLHELTACLVSHEHGDHACAAHDLAALGIPVLCSAGTAQALGAVDGELVRGPLRASEPVRVGTFSVSPFPGIPDAAEPLGFWLRSDEDGETLLFVTDSADAPWTLSESPTHIMIECNHLGAESMLGTNYFQARRTLDNHLSLADCTAFLRRQDLSATQDIRLIHISRRHGDPDTMRRAAAAASGRRIIIAEEEIER